jgi:hypothetical protein
MCFERIRGLRNINIRHGARKAIPKRISLGRLKSIADRVIHS